MAALGSSFAAGPTIEPVADPDALRSARNYPHLVAAVLGADLVDLTVSGATTATILEEPQVTVTGVTYPPQVLGIPRDADLVTVTAGGNDLSLVGSMLYSSWRTVEPDGPMTAYLGADLSVGVPVATERDVEAVATGLSGIAAAARDRAPSARIVLVDYLTLVGESTVEGPDSPFPGEDRAAFRRLQEALGEAFRRAAERSGVELLAMSAISERHALGSEVPWVFGFRSSSELTIGSFHPNEAGMRAVADRLVALVGR